MRPPRVAVAMAVQHCVRSDWAAGQCAGANRLAWLSVQDKMNFARLHGAAFHLVAVEVRHLVLALKAAFELTVLGGGIDAS